MRLNTLISILSVALAFFAWTGGAYADLVLNPGLFGKTLLIRKRSFAPNAPAGWTTTPFDAGAPGSPLINAQPAAIQAALRLVDVDSVQIYPVEPRPSALGPVDVFTAEMTRLERERAEIARKSAADDADVKALDTKVRLAEIDRNVLRARIDALVQQRRIVMRELVNRKDDLDARAQLADLDRQELELSTSLLRSESAVQVAKSQRDVRALAAKNEPAARAATIEKAEDALAGFYVTEAEPGCARPWAYKARTTQAVNPFYPNTSLESELADARLVVCVIDGRLHRTQLLDRENRVVMKTLYGRNAQGRIDRIVIRDAANALIEDHQYLPGPNQTVRYGLTFRTDQNALTSVYVDLPPTP